MFEDDESRYRLRMELTALSASAFVPGLRSLGTEGWQKIAQEINGSQIFDEPLHLTTKRFRVNAWGPEPLYGLEVTGLMAACIWMGTGEDEEKADAFLSQHPDFLPYLRGEKMPSAELCEFAMKAGRK